MKKNILSILLTTLSTLCFAQENNNNDDSNTNYSLKVKMGFSQLKIDDYNDINGNLTQIDFVLASKLSEKFKIDYGFGFSEFNGNVFNVSKISPLKNRYIRIPVNILYSRNFSNKTAVITGLGLYGNYLLKSEIPGLLDEKNVGVNFGVSIFTGVKFNITDDLDFGIMIEGQSDCTKIKKNNINQRLDHSSLIFLNFIYKF